MQHHNTNVLPTQLSLSAKDAHILTKYCDTPAQVPLPASCIQIHFPCNEHLVHYLRTFAKSSKDSRHNDVFYDGPQMTLVNNNCWLRFRDQAKISMKEQIKQNESSLAESWLGSYELSDEQIILNKVTELLAYQEPTRRRSNKPLTPIDVAWLPFAHFPFIRHEFETEYGTIHIDEMAVYDKCDDFYVLGTIKIYNSKDITQALAFLKAMDLDSGTSLYVRQNYSNEPAGPVRSKVIEWLSVREPETYKKLVQQGIVSDVPYQSEHYPSPLISKDLGWFKDYAFILEYGPSSGDCTETSSQS